MKGTDMKVYKWLDELKAWKKNNNGHQLSENRVKIKKNN